MNERIKNSIDNIEPESGAKERMYQNILKKAAKAEISMSRAFTLWWIISRSC